MTSLVFGVRIIVASQNELGSIPSFSFLGEEL